MNDVVALCYHGVSPTWPSPISTTPERLERQLAWFVRRGYGPATFRQAVLEPPPGRVLAVTFDDAYASVLAAAKPVLDRFGLVGSVYAPTALVGTVRPMRWEGNDQWVGTRHEPELVSLGWEELGGLAEAGWEVGSHSRSHPHLTRLPSSELEEELLGSRREIEARLGRPCDTIAYPYGHVDGRVAAAAARAGYRAGGAVASRRPPAALDYPRIGVWRNDGVVRLALKSSRLARRRARDPEHRADAQALPTDA